MQPLPDTNQVVETNPLALDWMSLVLFFSSLLIVAFFFLLVWFFVHCIRREKWLAAFIPIGFFCFLFFASIVLLVISKKSHVPIPADSQISEAGPKNIQPVSELSTEALWDQITRSRIELNGEEQETTPRAEDEETPTERSTDDESNADATPPDWVTTPPKPIGNVYRQVLTSDPFVTKAECQQQLEGKLLEAVARRMEQVVASEVGYEVEINSPLAVGIGLDTIFREICREEYTTTMESSVGEMQQMHLLLEFNPSVDRHLRSAWVKSTREARVATVAKSLFFTLTGLAFIYGALQMDTWTRGYYSKQLLAGVLAAIILVVYFLI